MSLISMLDDNLAIACMPHYCQTDLINLLKENDIEIIENP